MAFLRWGGGAQKIIYGRRRPKSEHCWLKKEWPESGVGGSVEFWVMNAGNASQEAERGRAGEGGVAAGLEVSRGLTHTKEVPIATKDQNNLGSPDLHSAESALATL